MSRANVKGTVMASVMNVLMKSVVPTLTSLASFRLTSFRLTSAKTSPSRSNAVVRWLTTLLVLGAFGNVHAQDQTPQNQAPQQAPFAISRRSTVQLDFRAGDLINCQLTDIRPGQTQLVRARLTALGDEVSPSTLFDTQLPAPLELTARDLIEEDDGHLLYTLAITNPSDETITRANLVDPLPTNTALQTLSVNCQASAAQPRALLLTQLLPEGADYVAGSSQLDNVPQADPYIANERLYWLLPYQPEGQLGFALNHTDALADLEPATLTLHVGTRDVFMIGEQPSSDLPADLRAAVLTDMPMLDMMNASDKRLTFVPLQLVADGRNPIELELQLAAEALTDMQEEPESPVLITIETGLEPLIPDAAPLQSGYQLVLDDDGRGLLRLAPQTTVRDVRVQALMAGDVVEASFRLRGTERLLYQYQGTLTATLTGSTVLLEGVAQGYTELPLAAGTLQAALDVAADVDSEAESFTLNTERGLRDEFDPSDRFPLTGAANEASPTLRSDDGIALKYSQDGFSAGYYADSLSVPGVGGFQRATALRAETSGDVAVAGFAALVPESNIDIDITPDGTRRYRLGEGVARGSEQLVLFTARGERPLVRNRDYSINYTSGVVTLAEPLWPFDRDFASQFLRVSYAPADAARDTLAYGVGGRYTSGAVSIGAGIAYIDELRFGADVRYRQPEFGLNARYTVDLIDDELENSRFTVNADGRLGDVNASANLTYTNELDVRGRARAALEVTPGGSVALEHAGSLDTNRTSALYEQDLGALLGTASGTELGTDGAEFVAGLGASYVWEADTVGALGRLRYSDEQTRLELTHTQTFDDDATSLTSLLGRYLFDDNLSADGNLDYRWGDQLAGSVGLNQRLGDANLSLAYQLPGASGEGNRARFGMQAPFALTDSVSVDLNAGYDYDLDDDSSQAAVGVAARYSSPTLSATLGSEVAFPTEGDTKLTLRAGASGQVGDTQTLSADANYEVAPDLEGSFTLAYSLRLSQLTLLTYHRLTTEDDKNMLEGEFAPTYTPDLRWQLRPAFAYQLDFDDDDGNIYQITLGGLYYFDWLELFGNNDDLSADRDNYGDNVYAYPLADDRYNPTLGVGGFAHYAWQSSGEDFIGFSVELGMQPLEPLWVSLGYTFNDFPGITATSRGGVYLRLDVTDARQE